MGGNTVSIRGKLVRPNFHLRVVKVNSEEEKVEQLQSKWRNLIDLARRGEEVGLTPSRLHTA